jgi:hypothetical protein
MKIGCTVAFVLLAIAATVIAAFLHHTSVLEWRFVIQRQITAVQSDGRNAVRISGFCGQGALSVKDIRVRRSGFAQLVTVRLFFARRGTTGHFQVDVPIEDGVNEIRFGEQEVLIWQRNPR